MLQDAAKTPSGHFDTSRAREQPEARLSLADEIDFQSLLGPTEELFKVPSLEILLEVVGGVEVNAVAA